MVRKKILIFSHAMEIGGAENALLGLLETIDTDVYEVDLFLMRHSGELFKYIPKRINILPEIVEYSCLAVPIKNVIKKRKFSVAAGRVIGKWKAKKRVKKLRLSKDNDVALEYSHKFTLKMMPMISNKEYDLAISFLTPHYFVMNKVKAKRKAAWIHTDYSVVEMDRESQYQMWKRYDTIVAISEKTADNFLMVFPKLRNKVAVIENILPENYIHLLAKQSMCSSEMQDDGCIKLLSIGRFCVAKNFDNVPDICRRLRLLGCNVKWYLIGYGGDEELIRQNIIQSGMQDYVRILGKKANPYPYIGACDLYVQPSRYEGKSVTVREAQMFGKPVVITDYASAESQLENGVDGMIVPLDNEKCANELLYIIENEQIQLNLKKQCLNRDYTNKEEIFKVYNLIL